MQRVARNDRNNEILWNYTKKEDQLMSAAFGTQPKRRLNRVMDTLNFKYPDYERLDKGAKGIKRKMIVSILSRQADRLVKKDEKVLKKSKIAPSRSRAISWPPQRLLCLPRTAQSENANAQARPAGKKISRVRGGWTCVGEW